MGFIGIFRGMGKYFKIFRYPLINKKVTSKKLSQITLLCTSFVGRHWEIYLREMEQDGTYGDQVTLQAISNICTIQICVLSTLRVGADVEIQPQVNSSDNVQSYPQVFLGHCG